MAVLSILDICPARRAFQKSNSGICRTKQHLSLGWGLPSPQVLGPLDLSLLGTGWSLGPKEGLRVAVWQQIACEEQLRQSRACRSGRWHSAGRFSVLPDTQCCSCAEPPGLTPSWGRPRAQVP